MRIIPLSLIVIALTCSYVEATVLEFPLTTMTGGFATYQASIPYTDVATPVLSVKLQATFTVDKIGNWQCTGFPEGYLCPRGVGVSVKVWENQFPDAYYCRGIMNITETGTFNETLELAFCGLGSFSDLANGDVIEILFSFDASEYPCEPNDCFFNLMPAGTLTSVKLLVEVPEDPTPVRQTTWGHIKSLFDLQ